MHKKIEIMDTTLRDGEQTSGVAFTDKEKFTIAQQLLADVKVDRIEIASARVSKGEYSAVKSIMQWAAENNFLHKIEVLGFVDENQSVNWIHQAGGKCLNLLTKGSLRHLEGQLRKTPEAHVSDIKRVIEYANSLSINVNVYLEDWSNGMLSSPDYVMFLIEQLSATNIQRFMLPDTLGILHPQQVSEFIGKLVAKFPNLHFDFHGHNDYDLAVANTLAAVMAGVKGIHTSVNGLGERTGNTILSSVVPVLKDHLMIELQVKEDSLAQISRLVEVVSGIRIPVNKPIIGEHVFTQTAGVHADGDNKGNLYCSQLMPERFGRVRKYALGKTSGKANILKNLQELGIVLDAETMQRVTDKVIELGDRKESITTEDLPYIIADILGASNNEKVKISNYYLCCAHGLKPVATLCLDIDNKQYQETSAGDGQYDAVMNALQKIYKTLDKKLPLLTDYEVAIPPGGETDALVETVITWQHDERVFKTRGLDPDQTSAAIKATVKMLNLIHE